MAHASDAIATPFSDERKKAYFNPAGKDKPLKSPIPHAVLERARAYRKQRMVNYVNKYDCDAILLYAIASQPRLLNNTPTDLKDPKQAHKRTFLKNLRDDAKEAGLREMVKTLKIKMF